MEVAEDELRGGAQERHGVAVGSERESRRVIAQAERAQHLERRVHQSAGGQLRAEQPPRLLPALSSL